MKTRHEKLYRATGNELVNIESSALRLTKGKLSARDEAHLAYLQDRNMFDGMPDICPHCREGVKSINLN